MHRPDADSRRALRVWRHKQDGRITLSICPPGPPWRMLGRFIGVDPLLDEYETVVGVGLVYESLDSEWTCLDTRYIRVVGMEIPVTGWKAIP